MWWYCDVADKQQELDLPSFRVEDSVTTEVERTSKKDDKPQRAVPMSCISGVKRPLTHTNSFTGEKLPKYGVETKHEEELGKVSALPVSFLRKPYATLRF